MSNVEQSTGEKTRDFSKPSRWNWFMILVGLIVTGGSLLTVLPPLFSDHLAELWPFAKPQLVVIVFMCMMLLVLVSMAHQRRHLESLHAEFAQQKRIAAEHAKRHTARVYALLNVSRVIGSWSDLDEVFDSVTRLCVEIFDCHQASLMILDKESSELAVKSASGESVSPEIIGARVKLGKGVAGWAAQDRKALLLHGGESGERYPGLQLKEPSITASMVVPIIVRDELVGVLNASSRSPEVEYDKDDLRALQVFAENVGTCIRHAEHMHWMRHTIQTLQDQIKTNTQPA